MPSVEKEFIRSALDKAFPDSRSVAADAHVEQIQALLDHGAEARDRAQVELGQGEAPLYVAHANHKRLVAPHSEFEQDLVMALIDLPESEPEWTIETKAGKVHARDHKLPSIAHFRQDWEPWLRDQTGRNGTIDRIQLLAPCRLHETRFAAIATYVGYFSDAPSVPAFVVLEAGLATGESVTLYYGTSWSDHPNEGVRRVAIPQQRAHYTPTPFSSVGDYYEGHVDFVLAHPTEISGMHVKAQRPEKTTYVEVDVRYERDDAPKILMPAFITANAALRVGAIELALGRTNGIEAFFGLLGHLVPWKRRP